MASAELMTHLKTLDGVKLVEADYETIGKMVTAAVLRENEKISDHPNPMQMDTCGLRVPLGSL